MQLQLVPVGKKYNCNDIINEVILSKLQINKQKKKLSQITSNFSLI
jgi:hypothetical protein